MPMGREGARHWLLAGDVRCERRMTFEMSAPVLSPSDF